ncbi:MAG TPA: protein kinase [Verrucomicrobiae bacterium]|nr:protein kinase [Verrucomicrobiae bacterium]
MPDTSKLGHFNLLEEIAHGGMGTVFRAFDPTLNREVAIKVLREDLAHDPKFLNDFLQEARSAAAISHPHIVQIFFVGEEKGQYYIVMELLHGRTLREIIEKDGPIPEEHALELTIDVVEGLRAAYRNKMIHGDIKPANVFITEDTGAKVLDFGLSKLANVEVAPSDGIWGSPYYISPERVGQKAEDFRSDVYSLGATLFQALTGHPPFEADTPEELAAKRLNEKPPLLRDLSPDLTRKTEEVVNKMLNKSILLRYRDYDALLEDLKDAKTEATAKRLGVDLHPELQPPPPAPVAPAAKSPLPLVAGAVAIVLAIVGILAYFFWPRTNQPQHQQLPQQQPQQNEVVKPPPPPAPPPPPPKPPKPAPRTYNVEFTISAPNAHIVNLAGVFNNWSPTATRMHERSDGTWAASVQLPAGRYDYKFIVDGKWILDPENSVQEVDPDGSTNSVLVINQ